MVRTLMTPRGEAITLTSEDPRYPPILSPEAAEILGDILNLACHAWRFVPGRPRSWLEADLRVRLAAVGAAWMLEEAVWMLEERDG
jgi:hypothetical protein